MLIKEQAAGFETVILAFIFTFLANVAHAEGPFRLEKNTQGKFGPFKAVSVPLPVFLREYSRVAEIPIVADGAWENELQGSVTLFIRRPMNADEMKELVYRVLNDNGYAAIDAPAGNGWMVERNRDARDGAIPVFEASKLPATNRLVTVHETIKFANADSIARMMRSFMPPSSRILSTERSQILITDIGVNIQKLDAIISQMDNPEAAQKEIQAQADYAFSPQHACGEQHIDKLVVEKLEIQDNGSGSPGGSNSPIKHVVEGAKK